MTNATPNRLLPPSWVERIFDRMQGLYGNLWLDRWRTGELSAQGADMGMLNAKATWAYELANLVSKPDAIAAALEGCRHRRLPPTLPEFLELCREELRRQRSAQSRIAYVESMTDRTQARQMLAELAQRLSSSAPTHGLRWAEQPASQAALDAVITEAHRGNRVMAAVLERLIEQGIANKQGRLLICKTPPAMPGRNA